MRNRFARGLAFAAATTLLLTSLGMAGAVRADVVTPTDVSATRAAFGNPCGQTVRVVVQWKAPASDGGSAIMGYTVTGDGSQHPTTVGPDTYQVRLTDEIAFEDPSFSVVATNAVGSSAPATAAVLTAPGPIVHRVAAHVRLSASHRKLTAKVRPARCQWVAVQVRRSGHWHTVESSRARLKSGKPASSAYVVTYRAHPGRWRVLARAGAATVAAKSKVVRIK